MDFGVATATRGALETARAISPSPSQAEKLGFGFISVNDHVVVPRDIASRYPYSDDGDVGGAHGRRLPRPAGNARLSRRAARSGCSSSPRSWWCPSASRC